jgi:hypothetical protein
VAKRVPGDEGALPNAFYDTNTDEIVIRHDQFDAQTVIHEGTHAAYHRAIDDSPKLKADIRAMMDAVEAQYVEQARRDGKSALLCRTAWRTSTSS